MCNIGTKISSNNAMPSWVIFLIEFLLDVCSDILKVKPSKSKFQKYEMSGLTFSMLYFSNA